MSGSSAVPRGDSARAILAGPVALLVLLAAAAGARIVAAHLRPRPSPACAPLPRAFSGLPSASARPSVYWRGAGPASAAAAAPSPRPAPRRLHPHQLADELVVDGRQHLHEAVVAFLLVLLLRVLLAVAAQADALAQVVHRQQVVLPQLVDGRQEAVLRAKRRKSSRRTPPRGCGRPSPPPGRSAPAARPGVPERLERHLEVRSVSFTALGQRRPGPRCPGSWCAAVGAR